MHTFFTWMVYLPLFAFHHLNHDDKVCALKLVLTLVVSVVLYDVPGVFHAVFGPLTVLLGFHDPLHPEFTDALHEWFFRSGLDHLVWIFGMFCAFSFPWLDRKLLSIETLPPPQKAGCKLALFG